MFCFDAVIPGKNLRRAQEIGGKDSKA